MKKMCLALVFVMLMAATAAAAELKFSWQPNIEPDLAGYRVYYGQASRKYDGNVDVGLPALVDGKVVVAIEIPYGSEFFAATAYSAKGFESDFSNEATGHINPASPGGFAAEEIKIIYKLTVPR
jgi:hypothetical protein